MVRSVFFSYIKTHHTNKYLVRELHFEEWKYHNHYFNTLLEKILPIYSHGIKIGLFVSNLVKNIATDFTNERPE